MSELITVASTDACLQIGIDRPDKRNSLTREMYTRLRDALTEAEHDDRIRAVLLHGRPDCFCAGNDLSEFLAAAQAGQLDRAVEDFLLSLTKLGKPLVVAVEGPAIGIGTTMLLHADVVVAGRGARFQTPFVELGLCSEAASSLLLPAHIGHIRAARLLLLGDEIDAPTALEFGLVTTVCDAGAALAQAQALAARLVALPASSVQTTKRLMKAANVDAVESTMQDELHAFRKLLGGPAAREAVTAFLEKRRPDFRAAGV